MSRSRSAWLAAVLIVLCGQRAGAMEHFGLSRSDQFLLCARALFGKPVFRGAEVFRGPSMEIDIPCPSTRDALMHELEGSGTYADPEKIKVVELPDLAFLYPSRLLYKRDAWIRWKRLEVQINVQSWRELSGSRSLTEEERDAVSKVILRKARTVPLVTPSMPGRDGETAKIEVTLWLDARRLAAGAAESVVGILEQSGGAGRLIYGEIREGKYEILWDSPLFETGHLGLSYEDMDGDGTEEILSAGEATMGGGPNTMRLLSVWDRKGREMSREERCETRLRVGYTKEGGACPIQGMSIEIEPGEGGKKDVLVGARPGWYQDENPKQVFRYCLVNGHYEVVPEAKKKPRH